MTTSLIGKTIGNLRIRERIGGGGVGHIWLAEDTALGRTVAVKMLRPELLGRGDVARRFRAEAQILARLNHPNIATIHSLLEDDGSLFMVMEFVEGRSFAALLRQAGRLPIEPCFDLFHQAMDGVQHAHEAGVIHRDLKPGNLMVDERGLVKVLDFGIAQVEGGERMTQAGNRVGTPEYMSPEQIRGGDANERSDVYSLAIVLYELLTGQVPFRKQAEYDVMRAQVEQAPTPPSQQGAEIDERLEAPILQALAKAPEDRFASVVAFQEALVAGGAPARTGTTLRAWVHFDSVDHEAPTQVSNREGPPTLTREIPAAATRPTEIMIATPELATRGPVLTHLARVALGMILVTLGWIGLNWLAVDERPSEPTLALAPPQGPLVSSNPNDVAPLAFPATPEKGTEGDAATPQSTELAEPRAEAPTAATTTPEEAHDAEAPDDPSAEGWVIRR